MIVESGNEEFIEELSVGKIIVICLFFEVIYNGGLLMWLIGVCFFVLMVFVFECCISFCKGRIILRFFVM